MGASWLLEGSSTWAASGVILTPAFDDMKSRYIRSLIKETDRRFPSDTLDLLTHFSCSASADDARSEFAMLKQITVSRDLHSSFSFKQFAEAVVIPIASVSCECGFSTKTRIKTKHRNSLNGTNHTHLMHISELGPPQEQFDFNRALIKWKQVPQRRQRTERTAHGRKSHQKD